MENQRVRLSKKMLKDSLIRLLHKSDLQDISVQQICQEAQINRSTFYKYYGSQSDLLSDIEKDVFSELESYLRNNEPLNPNSIYNGYGNGIMQILTYFDREPEQSRLLLNTTTDRDFADKLFQLPVIRDIFRKAPHKYTEEQAQYIYEFITRGSYAMILRWINKENREPPEEIAQLLRESTANMVTATGYLL